MPADVTAPPAAATTVLCSGALRSVLCELAPQFERNRNPLALSFGPADRLKSEIDAGRAFDVAILTPPLIEALIRNGTVAQGSAATIARTGVGLAVRAGAPKPDIGSVEAFRRALLAAKSIAFTTAGQSGIHFARVIEKLGVAAQIRAKGTTIPGGLAGELVVKGTAEMAVQLIPELMAVPGIEIVGPFPSELQSSIILTAGIAARSSDKGAAQALTEFLTAPAAAAVIRAKGLEPG